MTLNFLEFIIMILKESVGIVNNRNINKHKFPLVYITHILRELEFDVYDTKDSYYYEQEFMGENPTNQDFTCKLIQNQDFKAVLIIYTKSYTDSKVIIIKCPWVSVNDDIKVIRKPLKMDGKQEDLYNLLKMCCDKLYESYIFNI